MAEMESDKRVLDQVEALKQGKITRREFIARATMLGLSAAVAEALALAACSPQPANPQPATQPPSSSQPTSPPAAPTKAGPAPTGAAPAAQAAQGWGVEHYPYPKGVAFIETNEMACQGCGICQMACSMFHYDVINKDLARIRIEKVLLPIPKAVQVTCTQCIKEERECQKACPVNPPAIYYDDKLLHMVVNEKTCLGMKCDACEAACPAKVIVRYPAVTPAPILCDLCEKDGVRKPSCVDVCPSNALYFKNETPSDNWRQNVDQKAANIQKRLYPLDRLSMGKPGWRT